MKANIVALCLLFMFPVTVLAGVVGKPVDYRAADTVLKGYLAYDDGQQGKRPGVLVVHEWWGHNDYARQRARQLARLGYTALAVDMYGDGKQAAHPEDAGKFSGAIKKNMPLAESRFRAALELLQKEATVDGEKIAAIGYCFGGAIVLEMARRGLELDAVASFHGSLGTSAPAQQGKVKAKVLVANGADDPFVKAEQISAFKAEMDAAGVDYQFVNYPGAKHSFTNPEADSYGQKFGLPLAYSAEADSASWQALQDLLNKAFAR